MGFGLREEKFDTLKETRNGYRKEEEDVEGEDEQAIEQKGEGEREGFIEREVEGIMISNVYYSRWSELDFAD